jgi:hypothetical protein
MKQFIGILAVLSFLGPITASASTWWNPLTWFDENAATTTESVIAIKIDEPVYATTTEEVTEPAPQVVTKTVVQTNTVTKYVDNPTLVAENTALKAQIATLIAQVNQLKARLNDTSAPLVGTEETSLVNNEAVNYDISLSSPVCYESVPGFLANKVKINYAGYYDYGTVQTSMHKGLVQNNVFIRDISGGMNNVTLNITKDKPYVTYSNSTGKFPVEVKLFLNGQTQPTAVYGGEVEINSYCE